MILLYMYYLLFYIILIIIIYIIFQKYLFNNDLFKNDSNIEHFYTLFLPFYYPETIKKYQHYATNFTDPNLKKYKISFLITNQQLKYTYFHLFLKSLIAYNYPIINVNLLAPSDNDRAIMPKINNAIQYEMGIISAPILANQYINDDYNNVRYITSLNEQYIFILSPIDKNIDTLRDLDGKIIGVGYKESLWDQCAKDIFHNIKINYIPYHSSLKDMLQRLYNNKLDAIIITDSYPSNILNFIFYNFYGLHLISLEKIYNLDYYYTKTKLDLNKLPALYLPQASYRQKHDDFLRASLFRNVNRLSVKYLFYYSQFITFKFNNYLIGNKNIPDDLVYMITEHIFNNRLMLKKSDNAYTILPIPFHPGSKKYYLDKGYMSNNKHMNCIYMYGKQKYTKKTLQNTELNVAPYYNLL